MKNEVMITIFIPISVLTLELVVRGLLNQELWSASSVTLSGIALGQILPYLIVDNMMLSKVFSLQKSFEAQRTGLTISYLVEPTYNYLFIDKIHSKVIRATIFGVILFLLALILTLNSSLVAANFFAVINALQIWYVILS